MTGNCSIFRSYSNADLADKAEEAGSEIDIDDRGRINWPAHQDLYKIYNELGYGFLERVYQNAFMVELANEAMVAESEKRIAVFYQGRAVGTFEADLIVNDKVIIELKSKEALHPAHEAQLVNYLRATDIEIGLLFNFGKNPEFKRKYFSNKNKNRDGDPQVSDDPFKYLLDPDLSASSA